MSPIGILFLLFLLVPLVEIYFLIKVGNIIGAVPTIALVVFTALLGAMLLRFQGLVTLTRSRQVMAQGSAAGAGNAGGRVAGIRRGAAADARIFYRCRWLCVPGSTVQAGGNSLVFK